MKSDPQIELVSQVAASLDDQIDPGSFDAEIKQMAANPALMESLMAVQFVKDAVQGNPCLDKRYTARIMQFIATAEAHRISSEKGDK